MEQKDISDVLSNLALDICQGKDGRNLSEYDAGSLVVLAQVAARLDLPDAEKFQTLANTARAGHVRDLTRAALTILTGS